MVSTGVSPPPGQKASDARPSRRRKAVLICQICDYESPIDGDWIVRPASDDDDIAIVCPDCGTVIVTQPRFSVDSSHPGPSVHCE